MKCLKRFFSILLSVIIACPLYTMYLPNIAIAAENNATIIQSDASITLTVKFDLPQSLDNVKKRDMKLKLTKNGENATFSFNTASKTGTGFQYASSEVEAKNKNGVEITTESLVGSYDMVISHLETGNYTIELSGEGFTTFTQNIQLFDYSKHIVVSTSNGTFSLGDINNDGVVDEKDRKAISNKLGQKNSTSLYDLNGDGIVDVSDIAYIHNNMGISGNAEKYETAAIVSASIDTDELSIQGNVQNLLNGKEDITFSDTNNNDIIIPISFQNNVEMSEIVLTSPYGTGSIVAGTAILELADGSIEEFHFDNEAPKNVHAIGNSINKSTVTINLGKKVAVKKVTIKVTKVIGQDGKPQYIKLTQIQFLKDVILDDAQNVDSKVRGLSATAGDGKVSLKWNNVSNVTNYIINYGTEKNNLNQSVTSNVASAEVSGLKNLTTYYFQVTAANGQWKGTPSDIISAKPEAAKVPGAPSNISVTPANESLRISWGKTKDASYYQMYYRKQGESNFVQFDKNTENTNGVITGLVNGTTYEIAIKAGNSKGVGPYSSTALGTPNSENFDPPAFPTEGRIDRSEIESIVIADKSNVDTKLCPNFEVEHLVDNDANTYWVAGSWTKNSAITYTFKTPHDMNYILFAPYLDAKHTKVINRYSITAVNDTGKTVLGDIITDSKGNKKVVGFGRKAGALTKDNYIVMTFPEIKNVKSITVELAEVEGGGARVSVSEIAFYDADKLSSEIASLFLDNTFTALKSDVTSQKIQQLSDRLTQLSDFYMDVDLLKQELELAQKLLSGDNSNIGVIKNDFQSRSASFDSQYKQSASDLQPIGVSVLAESTVAIYAEVPNDSPVYIVPTQYYGESGIWKGKATQIQNGRNYVVVDKIGSLADTRGGMLYITYAGNQPEKIKLHIMENNHTFAIPVLELSKWYDMSEEQRKTAIQNYVNELSSHVNSLDKSNLQINIKNATEISTPSVLLSLPADQVLAGLNGVSNDAVNTMYQNVLAWEEVLFVANKVQGIIDADASFDGYRYTMSSRQNIRYMRMFAGAFMYAAGNHVGIGYGSASGLVCGKPTTANTGSSNGLFGWGIAHEIGHNMDKLGKAEVTNNIYSLAIQAWNGNNMATDTRLTKSNKWDAIYNKVAIGREGIANDVFVQLGMYWQLHLAYDDGGSPLKFYNEFFKKWKNGEYSGKTYNERVALIASDVAQKDLSEFFTRWGMVLSADVKQSLQKYTKENRAIWYLNDKSYQYKLSGGSANNGNASIITQVNNNIVTITLSNTDNTALLGYEIIRNGVPIGFTTNSTYQDNLGAANNLAYTYSAIPVDLLGNMGTEVTANEIRIAYDKKIDASNYDITNDGNGITITVKGNAIPVTGILSSTDGNATIKVKANAQQSEWTTVKQGHIDADIPVYFNKPGAESSDTRIWTYDVAVMYIEGINGDIELLDYPGDRIDFYSYDNANVAILAQDYQYGDDTDNVIKKGTLVILGNYRGNPGYNTVEIQAIYNTTAEANETETTLQRPMNGYALLLSEIPKDGAVSDTSDGFFIFVPDLEAEKELNQSSNVTDDLPIQIKALLCRTDVPESDSSSRVTSETLWINFPDDTVPNADGTINKNGIPNVILKADENYSYGNTKNNDSATSTANDILYNHDNIVKNDTDNDNRDTETLPIGGNDTDVEEPPIGESDTDIEEPPIGENGTDVEEPPIGGNDTDVEEPPIGESDTNIKEPPIGSDTELQ